MPLLIIILIAGGAVLLLGQKGEQVSHVSQTEVSNFDLASRECSGNPLVELSEGPYYKEGSPERQKISEERTPGTHLILKGYVLDTDCQPVANAWLDFWQADGEGNYDNEGFNVRGHQYTEKNGFFRLETVVPGEYPGRPPHIHFKVRASEGSRVLTSQLFFPEEPRDSIFDESLVVDFGTDPDGSKFASYTIVIPKN